jgi:hypothetical protein
MRSYVVSAALCFVLLSPELATADGAVRVTGGAAKLRASHDVRSDLGWIGGIELQAREGWPFLGMTFGNIAMPNASKPLGMMRFGATFVLPIPGVSAGPVGLQVLVSGGGQWTRFPNQDELPLAPAPGGGSVATYPSSEGWSPYGGVGLGLNVGVGESTHLSLEGNVTASYLDGLTEFYPAANLAITWTVPEL